MPYDFQPDPERKGHNQYVGSWQETPCRPIPLPFTLESTQKLISMGKSPESSEYTHQEIARWCDQMHMALLDAENSPETDVAVRIVATVDCQWDLFLANTFTLAQLQKLDFSKVRLPPEWFADWLKELESDLLNLQRSATK